MPKSVHIVGAGLAGSEAAHDLAESGIEVVLHEMRPLQMTPAHQTGLRASGLRPRQAQRHRGQEPRQEEDRSKPLSPYPFLLPHLPEDSLPSFVGINSTAA